MLFGLAVQVYKALHNGVKPVAVKICINSDEHARQNQAFWREIELIASCRDRNILQFYGACMKGVRIIEVPWKWLLLTHCMRHQLT